MAGIEPRSISRFHKLQVQFLPLTKSLFLLLISKILISLIILSLFQSTSSEFRCPKCPKTFLYEENKDRHAKRCLFCPHCVIKQSNLTNLRRHILTCQRRMTENLFKCDKCNKYFAHRTNLNRHKRRSH